MAKELKKNPDILKYDLAAVADVLNRQLPHISFGRDGSLIVLKDEYGSFYDNLSLWFKLKMELKSENED